MADVEARIQARVFPRRIRIKDFFVDFDKHRCGRVLAPHPSAHRTLQVFLVLGCVLRASLTS